MYIEVSVPSKKSEPSCIFVFITFIFASDIFLSGFGQMLRQCDIFVSFCFDFC